MKIQSWSILGRSFHFGLQGMGQEKTSPTFSSDSLFASLVARLAYSTNADAVEAFCRPFVDGNPPFVMTSTYPLAGNVRFFPPPVSSRVPPENSENSKAFKQVQYVSEKLYRRLLAGAMLHDLGDVYMLQGGKLWAGKDEALHLPEAVWEVVLRPRVTLDRASQDSTLFFTGQVTFAEGCGLWFGIRWLAENPVLKEQVARLLADLADAGLGAERNSGLGVAVIKEMGVFELPDPTGRWMTLSRYLPKADELERLVLERSAYHIQSVGGWISSSARPGQRRKTVNLMSEGSVFGALPALVPGQVVDARPVYESDADPLKHPVYRSGLALAVGLKEGAA